MRAAILCLALVLAGCGTTGPVVRVDANRMDANVRMRCEPIPSAPKARPMTMGALLEYAGELIGWGEECAARDAAKADWIESQGQ